MSDMPVIKIQRVKEGDKAVKPVSLNGFTMGVIPSDGFVIRVGEYNGFPVFVRDSDIQEAQKKRSDKDRPVFVDAVSWGKPNA